MAARSGGEQFNPGPSPASPSPATRAPNRLQRERGEAPHQSTERDRETGTGRGRGGDKRRKGRGGREGAESLRGGKRLESRLGQYYNFTILKMWQCTMQLFRPHDGSKEL